ncbi:MAG: DUF5606 domain-containing protein [Muribaculaceae bacterium]|nr:DUF5606 domain-containing protein [Muribaculaceae bacterium]
MLKKILSIAGKSGLYKLVSYGKSMLIVENLETGKRTPAYARDKIVSLGDISIYTLEEDKPLGEVLQALLDKQEGKAVDADVAKDNDALVSLMAQVLPNYDPDRVHLSDIKKLVQWYNLLVATDNTEFKEAQEEPAEDKAE